MDKIRNVVKKHRNKCFSGIICTIITLYSVRNLKFENYLVEKATDVITEVIQHRAGEMNQNGAINQTDKYIHIATIVCGLRLKQADIMMWSAAVFTNHHIHFHIISPKEIQAILKKTDVLGNVDRVVYVDTDVIFVDSVMTLWKEFDAFNETTMAAAIPEAVNAHVPGAYRRKLLYPVYPPAGLNAGVMLLQLHTFRASTWDSDVVSIYNRYSEYMKYSDQDIINIFFAENPDVIHILPCWMNYRPTHCRFGENCLITVQHKPRLIHGSSDAFNRMSRKFNIPFISIFDTFSQVKGHNFSSVAEIKRELLNILRTKKEQFSDNICNGMITSILASGIS